MTSLQARVKATTVGRVVTRLIAAALLTLSVSAFALDSDRNQPAVINADDVELDFKDGTRTYTGNVTVVQGSMRLTCDKLVARFQNNKLAIATAYGSKSRLATFKQRPDGKPYDVIGRAEQLELDQIEQLVRLRNTASLQQGSDSIAGGLILYNMATDKMSVKGRSETQLKQKTSAAPAPAPAPTPAPAPSTNSTTAAVPAAPAQPAKQAPQPAKLPAAPAQPAPAAPVQQQTIATPAPPPQPAPAPAPEPAVAPAPSQTQNAAGTSVTQGSDGRIRIVLPPKSKRGN